MKEWRIKNVIGRSKTVNANLFSPVVFITSLKAHLYSFISIASIYTLQ